MIIYGVDLYAWGKQVEAESVDQLYGIVPSDRHLCCLGIVEGSTDLFIWLPTDAAWHLFAAPSGRPLHL